MSIHCKRTLTPSTCAVEPVRTILIAVLWARAEVIGASADWGKGENVDGVGVIPALPLP
ncbi:MAG: hypothetical protein GQ524_07640 [Anaerolineales bacterium]|nr:hypothetical protein [Anaerolineales bacterium]